MLSCGRVIGRLPKLTRHAQVNNFYRPLKYAGVIAISNIWYSKDVNKDKIHRPTGTTAKPEECVPNSRYNERKNLPPCESRFNPSCPPSCPEACGPPNNWKENSDKKESGSGKNEIPLYWKILAALIVTGVTIYAISSTNWFTAEKSNSQQDIDKKKRGSARRHRSLEKVKIPAVSSSIPQEIPYLLIGGGTAAFSAFRSIKSRDPKAKVLVISEEEDLPYMRPPLSKELWYNTDRKTSAELLFKQWNGTQRSIFYEPQEFYSDTSNLIESEKGGVSVARGWKVSKIDVMNKTVFLEDGYKIKYDKCLLATGASPKNLQIFESAQDSVKEKILTYRTKQDFLELEQDMHDPKCKNIVIIGGGFLGSELACSLAHNCGKDKKITQIYKEKFIMGQILPEYLSEWATKKAHLEGVHCIPNVEVKDFTYRNGELSLILSDDQIVNADKVIVAVGVEPNTEMAKSSHLETHPQIGGFLVNAELEARSSLWVAGDAACFYDIVLGRRRVEHHDHAVASGRLAGENMTGAGKPYLHQSMFWSDLGPEVGYEAVGVVDSSLTTVGVFAKPKEKSSEEITDVTNEMNEPSKMEENHMGTESQEEQQVQKLNESSMETTNRNKDTEGICDDKKPTEQPEKYDNFANGVIFYLQDNMVIGIVLWNIFNRMSVARQVLARGTKYEEINEVAKLFSIHDN